ncbi:MAG: ATP-binding protein [Candidatus Binatia bacterium]
MSWLKVIILITGEVSIASGLIAVAGSYTQDVNLLKVVAPILPMEYNAALGFILCGLGLLSIGFNRPYMAIAFGMAGGVGLLVVYFGIGLPTPELIVEEPSPLSGAVLVVGLLMAFLLAMAVHFAQTAWNYARQAKSANEELANQIIERTRAEEVLANQAAELERSNDELRQFAYVASHDLQEPLRMVASYTQLLAKRYKGKLDTDADEFIGFTLGGVTRMEQLIKDLLTYSRVGRGDKGPEPTDCSAILGQVLDNLRMVIEESGAAVTHDPLPPVMANATQLRQLFQNLISNALKFRGDEPPLIHVSSKRNGKQWIFSVQDNGIGIEPQYAERIFTIFQQLHNQADYPGTGIGLAICKKIVERHGGRIWVKSEAGKGSTFYFTMPFVGVEHHD